MSNIQTKKYFIIFGFALIASLSGFIFGLDAGVIADGKDRITSLFFLTNFQWSMITSITVVGALISLPISGRLTDKIGVKYMLMITALGFIFGLFAMASTECVYQLVMGRFIVGVCIGIATFCAPLFIAEIAPPAVRGAFVLINNVTITGGQAFSFFVGYMLHDLTTNSWRIILWIQIIAAVCFFLGTLLMPQTPKGKNVTIKSYYKDLFSKKMLPVLILGCGLALFQQFVGISAVIYYGPVIFQALGFSSVRFAIFATFCIGCINLIFTIVTAVLVDYIGRRKLLLFGTLLATISLFSIAFGNHLSQKAVIFFMSTYIMGYCVSLGSLFWVIVSEIYPLKIRGSAMALATFFQMLASLIVTLTFLNLFEVLGTMEIFSLFGLISFFAFLFVYFLVPETKGVPLKIIEENLNRNKKIRKLGDIPNT